MPQKPSFSYCGTYMFGPFTVKGGRKERKRYDASFTSLLSIAEHFEVTHSMTTDFFIMCFRNLIGHRRYARRIRRNNETNFFGASAALIESFQEMNHVKIGDCLQQNDGEIIWWKQIPSLTSNIGGVWEHQLFGSAK